MQTITVHVEDVLWFAGHVEGVGGFDLHAVGQLERSHLLFELRIVVAICGVLGIQRLKQVELPALVAHRDATVLNIVDQPLDFLMAGIHVGCLVDAWQKTRLPVLRFLNGIAGA